jgi:hypothetical protein
MPAVRRRGAPDVRPRIGDVLVAARAVAYYDDRLADKKPQRMIGQHGSLTDQERIVPLIRLGAFARLSIRPAPTSTRLTRLRCALRRRSRPTTASRCAPCGGTNR